MYPTEYLIQARPPNLKFSIRISEDTDVGGRQVSMEFDKEWFTVASDLVRMLRLFKPGHFARGSEWVCITRQLGAELEGKVGTSGLAFSIDMVPGPEPPPTIPKEITYFFDPAEMDCFKKFDVDLSSAFSELRNFPKLALAGSYFDDSFGEKAQENQIVDIFISLEALLLEKADELVLRLATRMANLLGADGDERKRVSDEVKDFYNVRSKIVHGEILKPKQVELVREVGRLRELARRAILSSVALGLEVGLGVEFIALLDAMSLDENQRTNVQKKASRFLYMHREG